MDADDSRLVALAESQRRADERLDLLAHVVEELADAAGGGEPGEAGAGAPWWPDLEPEPRATAWTELLQWLDEALLPRHSDLGRSLTPCWYRHLDVVDELTMLRATWREAYQGDQASATAVGDWLDRWLPNAQRRIVASVKDCRIHGHIDGAQVNLPRVAH